MQVGVGTGEAIAAGGVVLGDGVREAARLAGRAAAGDVLLDEATVRLVRHAVRTELVRGDHRVLALQEGAPAIPASPDRALVGRERELGLLRDALARARRDSVLELVTLLGEPGIGKSRLVRELAAAVSPSARILIGRCRSSGQAPAFAPLREMLEPVLGEGATDDQAQHARVDPSAVRAAAAALGLQQGFAAAEPGWAFCAVLAGLSTVVPLVLVFEDIHWADPALLELIERIVDELCRSRVLVVCVARPEFVETDAGWARGLRGATALTLGPLSAAESVDVLAHVSPLEMPEEARDRIVDAAGGNPLFLEQLVAHAGDGEASEPGPPPALQGLLDARLDALPPAERSTVDRAAIEGETFTVGGVLALSSGALQHEVEETLAVLVRRDLIVPEETEGTFRFRHALIAAAAYGSVPKAERAILHERFAGWLASSGCAVADLDARVGFHFERAARLLSELDGPPDDARELARSAAMSLRDAARAAHRHGDLASEVGFLDRAHELVGSADGGAQLLPALAAALFEAGDLDRAARVAERGVELGLELDLPLLRCRSAVERDRLRAYREPEELDVPIALASVEQRIAELDRLGDDLGVARASYLRCEYLWMQGHPDLGSASAEVLVERALRAGSGFEVAAGIHFMAWSLVEGATPVPAALDRCRDLERAVGGERVAALGLLGFQAVLRAMGGDPGRARSEMSRARSGLASLRLREAEAYMALFDAKLETAAGDLQAAERAILDARSIVGGRGDRWFLSTVLVDLALAILAQQRDDDAARVLQQVELHRSPNDAEWLIKRHIARGWLATRRGLLSEGLVDARRAVEIADATEMLVFRADAWSALAGALEHAGRHADATQATRQAIVLCHAKGNVAGARAREVHAARA
jgi:tetratricopeptide (TPR) repeat protein